MRSKDELDDFLRQGLASGSTPAELEQALISTGWEPQEVRSAFERWTYIPGIPPVPRPRLSFSPRDMLKHGLGFTALAMISWHITRIGFHLSDYLTQADGQSMSWTGSARWPVAMLIVFLPIFVLLQMRSSTSGPSRMRRWLAAISGFLAGVTLLMTLGAAVNALLSGDMSLRFCLKAGIVTLTATLVFLTYRSELNEGQPSRTGGIALSGLAALAIAAGLWLTGGPAQGRAEMRDRERQSDIAGLTAHARCLTQEGEVVPPMTTTAGCPGLPRLSDPWTGEPYRIEMLKTGQLRICANLETETFLESYPDGSYCQVSDLEDAPRQRQ